VRVGTLLRTDLPQPRDLTPGCAVQFWRGYSDDDHADSGYAPLEEFLDRFSCGCPVRQLDAGMVGSQTSRNAQTILYDLYPSEATCGTAARRIS
jgi:hypothetical protein